MKIVLYYYLKKKHISIVFLRSPVLAPLESLDSNNDVIQPYV